MAMHKLSVEKGHQLGTPGHSLGEYARSCKPECNSSHDASLCYIALRYEMSLQEEGGAGSPSISRVKSCFQVLG